MDQRRIYITSLSAKTGDVLWQQSLIARGRPFCHPTSANAAPTPASDGKLVFAFYSSNDLACVDLQGNLVWYRALAVDFPKAGNDVGMSASPIVADGVVVVQIENQGDSFVAGLEAETGELLWRKDRPKRANWSSPLAVQLADGKSIAVVQSSESLDGLDIRTGTLRWSMPMACSGIPSTSSESGRLFVPSSGLTQIELASSDQPPKKGWNNSKLSSNSASPVIYNGGVYMVNRSVLVRGDAVSGELSWQLRLPDAGTIWSSPVIAGNRLYLFTDNGRCFVVELGDKEGKIIETNELGEPVFGSPAVAGDAIFVRSDTAVWKIEKS
jgi:outer membrane protein assembly factor BamB